MDGFDVIKSGDARVAIIGFPSVGKSTFLNSVTKTESATASYEFTTLSMCYWGICFFTHPSPFIFEHVRFQ